MPLSSTAGDGRILTDENRASKRTGIGFGANVQSKEDKKQVGEVLREVEPEDLIHYGLIPEFVGRLPIVATLDELDEDADDGEVDQMRPLVSF